MACLRIGVTGHRPGPKFPDESRGAVRATVDRVLGEVAAHTQTVAAREAWAFEAPQPSLVVVSALAEGGDRIVADSGRALGYSLNAVLPFLRAEYAADFARDESRAHFTVLLDAAISVFELPGQRDTADQAYQNAGHVMLANSDVLIAIWDGKPAAGVGGTALIVERAIHQGLPVIVIDPKRPDAYAFVWHIDAAQTPGAQDPASAPDLFAAIDALLAPPRGGEAPKRLKEFFAERERRATIALAYPLLLLFAGVRRLRVSDFYLPDYVKTTAQNWKAYFGAMPQDRALAPVVRGPLLRAAAFADLLSVFHAQNYRSAYVFNFVAAALAVTLALFGVFAHDPPLSAYPGIGESLVVLAILGIVWLGRSRQWHRRWLEYRRIAEALRQLRMLAAVGARLPVAPADLHIGEDWPSWYVTAFMRMLPPADIAVDARHVEAVRTAFRDAELKQQLDYHRSNAARMIHLSRRLHDWATVLFFATAAICIAYVSLCFLPDRALAAHWHGWAIFLAGVFPTVGAAIHAVRAQGEFQVVGERSLELAARLEAIDRTVAGELPVFAHLSDAVEQAAALMLAEVHDWHVLFRARPLGLPA
jgi:hypothetical protein